MHTISSLTFTFGLLCIATLSHARLGDTERQCVERYGSPDAPPKHGNGLGPFLRGSDFEATYHYQGFRITCAFLSGRVVRQRYQREKPVNGSLRLTDAEIKAILDAESAGGTWKPVSPGKGAPGSQGLTGAFAQAMMSLMFSNTLPTWERSTDKALAKATPSTGMITLDTPEARQCEKAAREATKAGTGRAVPKF